MDNTYVYYLQLKKVESIPEDNPKKIAELEIKIREHEIERDNLNKQMEKLMDQVNEETLVLLN